MRANKGIIAWSTCCLISLVLLFPFERASAGAFECENWASLHPEWIFCDDFQDSSALVRLGRYFEYDSNNGDFVVMDGVGLGESRGVRVKWQQGEADGGFLHLAFGRNPGSGMTNGVHASEDFREIYYRMYMKLQNGWSGYPAKLSRATVIAGSDWRQAMIAHLWNNASPYLALDPASCVTGSTVNCVGYNDFAHLRWLGAVNGTTAVFDGQANHNDRWYCIESHVKLNDPGQSNGVQEYWIDGILEARKDNLNFVQSYTAYGINAIFFENYWNGGAAKQEERCFDNIVVSTQRIGCAPSSSVVGAPANLRTVPVY